MVFSWVTVLIVVFLAQTASSTQGSVSALVSCQLIISEALRSGRTDRPININGNMVLSLIFN